MNLLLAQAFVTCYDNTIDPLIPENWANESLMILEENMVIGSLVHRDFEDEIARYGQTVHTRRPGELKAYRKTNADPVTVQDVTSTGVDVVLNQWIHTSFLIKDGEETMAFKDLITLYMAPGILAQARMIDRILLGQYPRFFANVAGGLGKLTGSNARDYILDTRGTMNQNKAYEENRNLILGSLAETTMLKTDLFTAAYAVGDGGQAMRKATLGEKLGFMTYMSQNMASIRTGNTVKTATVSGNYSISDTNITITGMTGNVSLGSWATIDGDNTPLRVNNMTATGTNTTSIGFVAGAGLRKAVSNGAAVSVLTPGDITSGYAIKFAKEITVANFTVAAQVGQVVSFGTSATSDVYAIVDTNSTTGITLDRPLVVAINSGDKVNIGPAGAYNLAFHRNAIALVTRPLAAPKPGSGAISAVVNMNGLSMRATITYQGRDQGHLVTLDMLCGVQVLDTNLGCVLLG